MSHPFRRSVHLTVAVTALFIVLVSAIVRFIFWQRMEHSVEQAMQAAEVQSHLDDAFSLLQDAETGQRGFLLTGRETFLEPFHKAEQELPEQFSNLEAMLQEQPEAAGDFVEFKAAATARLLELSRAMQLFRDNDREQALAIVAEGSGNGAMNKIRALVSHTKEVRTVAFARAATDRRKVSAQPAASDAQLPLAGANLDDFPPSDILIVDDNPVNRELMAGIFVGTQHHVRFAANGVEALTAMSEKVPSLVLMDVRMPVMNGSEAVEKMRRKPDLESVPVIAVTASSLLPEAGNTRHRFNGYLRKPFSPAELYREIAQIIPRITGTGREKLPDFPPEVPDSEAHATAWQTAIRKLHQMESSSWAALRNSLAITEAMHFAGRLLLLAEAADCLPLRAYAATLRQYAASYAADDLEKHVAAFPQLIALLEERTTRTTSHAAA